MAALGARTRTNRSAAVVACRTEPPDSLDFFRTPPWAVRALFQYVAPGLIAPGHDAWEPACGMGDMVRPLREMLDVGPGSVRASDIFDYGWGHEVADFLWPGTIGRADWVITNPPFRLADRFFHRAREVARAGVAMLARLGFVEGQGRYRGLYRDTPPDVVAPFAERVNIVKGTVGTPLPRRVNKPMQYAWFLWNQRIGVPGKTTMIWIPPCRAELTRPEDHTRIGDGAP